jgi:hypothetical protein
MLIKCMIRTIVFVTACARLGGCGRMRWIDRVDFLDDDEITDSAQDLPSGLSRLSRWICSTIGFEVGNLVSLSSAENCFLWDLGCVVE